MVLYIEYEQDEICNCGTSCYLIINSECCIFSTISICLGGLLRTRRIWWRSGRAMKKLMTVIMATIIVAVFIGILAVGLYNVILQRALAKSHISTHVHCWKQRLYVYTNPVQPEDMILCHRSEVMNDD